MDKLTEYLQGIDEVSHITFDPKTSSVVRIHLIPPQKIKLGIAWVVIINGESILPISCGWAILLREFINNINLHEHHEISQEEIDEAIEKTTDQAAILFPKAKKSLFKEDLKELLDVILSIGHRDGKYKKVGDMTIKDYAKYMSGPHRMDLMISAMEKDGHWNCNQKCLNCYAAGEAKSGEKELTTEEWLEVINRLRKARIPQLTFTGGEPTLRSDLVELVKASSWFVTRLNTNGKLLTKKLCQDLYDASLDAVQVTLYSSVSSIHNLLVGSDGFEKTIEGIRNAVEAKLLVSINTPLCSLNKNYLELIKYIYENFNIKYFTCSGLILTGSAKDTKDIRLSREELVEILRTTKEYCKLHDIEVKFTTPGLLTKKDYQELDLAMPMCGACISNMAISPSGDVIPCQSWLKGDSFGNILNKNFKDIWKSKELKKVKNKALKSLDLCPLSESVKNHEKN